MSEQPKSFQDAYPEEYEKLGTGLVDMVNDLSAIIGPTDTARMLMALAISFLQSRQPSWITAKMLKQLSVRLASEGRGPN